jgi:hypothetical protein
MGNVTLSFAEHLCPFRANVNFDEFDKDRGDSKGKERKLSGPFSQTGDKKSFRLKHYG